MVNEIARKVFVAARHLPGSEAAYAWRHSHLASDCLDLVRPWRDELAVVSSKPVGGYERPVYRYPATLDLSVIVPAYNTEGFVSTCLEPVLSQEFDGSMEVVVVDDGSTDGTGAVIEGIAARDTRVVALRQENRGLSGARNTGIDIARGGALCLSTPTTC